ncbi:MAG: hypothetical protein P8016_17395 [Sedimentisphaerales bacterium]
MARAKRVALGGYVYHVLNRANGRLRIFRKYDDFLAFEQILAEAIGQFQNVRYRPPIPGTLQEFPRSGRWSLPDNPALYRSQPASRGPCKERRRLGLVESGNT